MFRFTHVFLLLEVLVATAQGSDLSFAGSEKSQADLMSYVKALQDDVRDLRTRLGEQLEKSTSQDVQARIPPKCKYSKVAFFAGLTKNSGPFSQNIDFVFDRVVTNNGSAYSAWSGRFKAPVCATYQFTVTVAALQTKNAAVHLVKNGVNVLDIWCESKPWWSMCSHVAILSLNPGDQVWVKVISIASNYHGNMYTSFSGFLIFEN